MSAALPRMFYFGPWDRPGHYLFREGGRDYYREWEAVIPWDGIDGVLQPGCREEHGHWVHRAAQVEGEALLHHKDGWTAISFWDRSVDTRGACNSTYFAEGLFTFDQMVEMARARFSERWNRMTFSVRQVSKEDSACSQKP